MVQVGEFAFPVTEGKGYNYTCLEHCGITIAGGLRAQELRQLRQAIDLVLVELEPKPQPVDPHTRLLCKAHDALNTARFEANGAWDADFEAEVKEIQQGLKTAAGL